MTRAAYVHEAEIAMLADFDPRAVGAAVTVALCGHWEHEGPCRWPHNNEISESPNSDFGLQIGESGSASDDSRLQTRVFRTLFVCPPDEEPQVRLKVRDALHSSSDWRVITDRERSIASHEQALADDLLHVPRRPNP